MYKYGATFFLESDPRGIICHHVKAVSNVRIIAGSNDVRAGDTRWTKGSNKYELRIILTALNTYCWWLKRFKA